MDQRAQLLLAWLEEEGERQERQLARLPHVRYPAARGVVQRRVSGLACAFAAGLFVCWLSAAWLKAGQAVGMEKARLMELYGAEAEGENLNAGPGAVAGRPGD